MLPETSEIPVAATSSHDHPLAAYVLAALVSALCISLPFLTVRLAPITDLPQQVAQIRLLSELADGASPYRLNLGAPGVLGYGVFALSWLVVGAEHAGRLAYFSLGLVWIAAFAVTMRSRGRDPVFVPLATLFFFSHPLAWGFFSFLFGAALFLLCTTFELRLRRGAGGVAETVLLAVGGLVLYSSHLLWFLAAALWLVGTSLLAEIPNRRRWQRLAALLPAGLLVAWWAPRLTESGFASQTMWWVMPWGRLAPGEWVDRVFGAIKGPVEPVILGAVVVWLVIGWWHHRSGLPDVDSDHEVPSRVGRSAANADQALDTTLLGLGCAMLALSLLLPDRFSNTLQFAGRWAPIGAALLVTAMPPPKIRPALRWAVAFVLLATLAISTTAAWRKVERFELDGLETSLEALPNGPRLLGLDFYRLSEFVKTQPFFQMSAYARVARGGELGFSFASFPASPVVFREWENPPWTPGLEWLPHEIFEAMDDVLYFDYVLVHADPAGHAYFAQQAELEPVTGEARWRLYRVVRGSGSH